MTGADGGTYTLVFELTESTTTEIGALGARTLPKGWYAYTGSALGTGGFARVDRHERVAAGEHDVRHWHVDYLAGDERSALRDVLTAPGRDLECEIARALGDGPVSGFGASDCRCDTHLAYRRSEAALRDAVEAAYGGECESREYESRECGK